MANYFELLSRFEGVILALEQILVGGDDQTVLVDGVEKDSISKAIKGYFSSIQALVQGRSSFETKSALVDSGAPTSAGLAEVWNDPSETLNGMYGWDGSEWIKSAYDVKSYVDYLVESTSSGFLLQDSNPNIYDDYLHENIEKYWSAAVVREYYNERWNLKFGQTGRFSNAFSRSDLNTESSTFSVSVKFQSRGVVPYSGSRLMVLQYPNDVTKDSADELVRTQVALGDDVWTESRVFSLAGIPLHADTVAIRLYVDPKADAHVSDICIASGNDAGFRPASVAGQLQQMSQDLSDAFNDIDLVNVSPNLIADHDLSDEYSPIFTRTLQSDGFYSLTAADDTSGGAGHDGPVIQRESISGNVFNAGVRVYYAQKSSARILVQQFDGDAVEIRDVSDGNGDYRYEFPVPVLLDSEPVDLRILGRVIAPACSFLKITIFPNESGISAGRLWLRNLGKFYTSSSVSSYAFDGVAYVSPSGLGSNSGSSSSPFNSIRSALSKGAKEIVVMDGVYSDVDLDINGAWYEGDLVVRSDTNAAPISRKGVELTGFVATAGRVDVYEVSSSVAPPRYSPSSPAGFVFVKDVPFGLITNEFRMPQHKGRSHMCPHYILKPVADLDLLESSIESSWFYDNTAKKLYVRSVPDSDPLEMSVVIPSGYFVYGMSSANTLRLAGVSYEFGGLKLDNIGDYYLDRVWNFGAPVDGLSLDRCSGIDQYCSVVASGNDNWNAHNDSGGVQRNDGYASVTSFSKSVDPYSAWAFDDGRSIHERAFGSVDGGLFEYCGSSGVTPAGGAEEELRNTYVRHCGWELPVGQKQGGVSVVNAVNDDGHDTVCNCFGVIVEGGDCGFLAASDSAVLNLFDTKTIGCSDSALNASYVGGRIKSYDHKDYGSAVFVGDGPGVVEVN